MNNYCVYRHTSPNGKMYVGVTRGTTKQRWKSGSGYKRQPRFYNAIQKYGWDNFKHEVLMEGLTRQQASLAERLFIGYWRLTERECGYNLSAGGVDFWEHSEETKRKLSELHKGKNNPMYGRTGALAPMYGKHHTEESKELNRLAHIGFRHTKEAKRRMSEKRRNENSTNKKPVYCVELDRVFWGAKQAWLELGVNRSCICEACKGKRKTAGGYHWKYYDEYTKERKEG